MKKFQLAIVGLGRAGEIHFKNIQASNFCEIKYAIDLNEEKLKQFNEEYKENKIMYVHSSKYSEILEDIELDGVVVCTPTNDHENDVLLALEKGKSVFCEKPISTSLEVTQKCYNLAKSKNLALHCSLNRRFDPSLMEMHRALEHNELGKIHLIKTCSRDSPKPSLDYLKISNGIYHDCAVHDLDMICWLLSSTPTKVYVTGFTNDPAIESIHDVETTVISLTFADGTLAMIDLSRQSTYGYDQRVEILGDLGMLESRNQRPHNVEGSFSSGTNLPRIHHSFPQRYRESYVNSLNHFIELIKEKKQSSVTAEEVIMLTKLANACEHSWKTGEVVTID